MTLKPLIRKSLREGLEEKIAAGVLIKAKSTNKVLLLLRNDNTPIWSLMSGCIENGETILAGLKREIIEELSISPKKISFKFIGMEKPNDNLKFHYFQGLTNSEFVPTLDHENLEYKWVDMDDLPEPLYVGLKEKIKNFYE
jgi:8-oxo-dGTP pyrophosphatase MutT (NUDIX family)